MKMFSFRSKKENEKRFLRQHISLLSLFLTALLFVLALRKMNRKGDLYQEVFRRLALNKC